MGQQIDWSQLKNVPPFLLTTDNRLEWETTSTPPDGVRQTFEFTNRPKFIVFNGVMQLETIGYTVSEAGPPFEVTFIDFNGTAIAPQTGDKIVAEIR